MIAIPDAVTEFNLRGPGLASSSISRDDNDVIAGRCELSLKILDEIRASFGTIRKTKVQITEMKKMFHRVPFGFFLVLAHPDLRIE